MATAVAAALLLTACGGRTTPADPAPSVSPSASERAAPPATTAPQTSATTPQSTAPSAVLPDPPVTIPDLPTPVAQGPVEGADVSWPQCPKGMGIPQKRSQGAPMPLPSARFVVLGLTNGPGFHPNPCLAAQVAWVKQRHLMAGAYSVISYPEKRHFDEFGGQGPFEAGSTLGRLANIGYQQALFNIRTMQAAGLDVPAVWLDVEPVNGFDWTSDTERNAAVVRGAAKAYADQGLTVGVYSTVALWQRVVGDLRLSLPEWRAAGETGRAEALRRCGADRMFQGGAPILTQWVEDGRDRDVTCPGGSTYLPLWFHTY
ncbi:hypothetical protein SAMN04487968_10166 [Nocardioides terrae]|uniref:Glycosyl hydrolases family 25 n=1 Tax=Nocardioides terrae TaxID=574651 RepID=A0A1I1DEA4_9ACTN|nr:hypothetical protein [Nocardioides terrae]SFB70863.1 hypothetical protein SAMN04487968_10166 [Nocardioides terrae]